MTKMLGELRISILLTTIPLNRLDIQNGALDIKSCIPLRYLFISNSYIVTAFPQHGQLQLTEKKELLTTVLIAYVGGYRII